MNGPPSRESIEQAAELASAMVYLRREWEIAKAAGVPREANEWAYSLLDVEETLWLSPDDGTAFRARYRACWLACERASPAVVWSYHDWMRAEAVLRDALREGWSKAVGTESAAPGRRRSRRVATSHSVRRRR